MGKPVNGVETEVAKWFETAASRYASLLKEKKYNEAVDALGEASEAFLSYGLANFLLEMIKPLSRRLISAGAMSKEKWAWLCNVAGLTYIHRDEIASAKMKFLEMKGIGEKLDNKEIISTALQNLGICSVELGKRQEALKLYRGALGLKREIGDKRGISQLYGNLANLHLENDEVTEAIRLAKASIRIKEEINEKPGLIASYNTLGIIESRRRRFVEAEKAFRRALALSMRVGDPYGLARSFINVASSCSDQGKYKGAIKLYQTGLAIAYDFRLLKEVELAMRGLAVTYYKNKEYQNSIKFFNAILPLTKKPLKEFDHAMVYHDLGTLHALIGKNEKADGYYRKAKILFQRLGDWMWVATSIRERAGLQFRMRGFEAGASILSGGIKLLSRAQQKNKAVPLYDGLIQECLLEGYIERARRYFEAQKAILLSAGDPGSVAYKAATLGAICLNVHLFREGIRFFEDAKDLYKELRDLQMLGKVLNDMGNGLQEMEDFEKAEMVYREALSLAAKTRDRVLEAEARNNLGEAERRAGNYRQAVSELRRAMSLSKLLDDVRGVAIAYNNLGLAFEAMGKAKDAERMFTASLKVARTDGNKPGQARALSSLGTLMFERGRSASALARYKKAAKLAQQSSDKDLEAEMWFNAATAEARMGRGKHASRSMQRAIDIAQDRRNYKLAAHICLAVCIENIKNEEAQESGKFFANAVIFSLLVSPQYAATIMGQLLILVRDVVNAKNDTLAKRMIDSAVRNLRKIGGNICRPFLDSFLLPLKQYLARADREAFDKFVLKMAHEGVG